MRTPIDVPRTSGPISVEPLGDMDELFAALNHSEVWEHIPGGSPGSAADLRARLTAPGRQVVVIRNRTGIVGTSSYIALPDAPDAVEIGATLLSPAVWGSGVNSEIKRIMLAAAFAHGARSVRLRTDERNHRSAAAILKLPGATELAPMVEHAVVRADGTVRTSRVFRVVPPAG